MAVVPDLLMPPAAESRARQTPAKTESARNDGASSFADVYSRERAAPPESKAVEPRAAAKDVKQSPEDEDPDEASLAESGNLLPDLQAMLGLGGSEDSANELAGEEAEAESAVGALLAGAETPQAPAFSFAQMSFKPTELEIDPQVRTLNSVQTAQPLLAVAADAESDSAVELAETADTLLSKSAKDGSGELLEQGLKLEALSAKNAPEPATGQSSLESSNKLNQLAQAVAAASPAAARAPLAPGQPVAMQQTGWSEAVVDRVMWLSSQNLKSAEIQLDPAELGRLDVRVNLIGDQTQVTFASAHAGVRDALESQMHRLREMFAQQGMAQPQVNVSDQSQSGREQHAGQSAGRGVAQQADEDELGAGMSRASATNQVARGLVDYYA